MKVKEKEIEVFVNELKELAFQLGATVRFEKGDFKGGYCIVKESKIIVINKNTNNNRRAVILSTALKELGVDEIYVQPKLRDFIEEMKETL
ncbi:MAG: hypothetical protein IAE91_02085 [Ignavibacteriaceae bacterium]|nr:hypothetical protein [Ignavibacteriaceae bacterium]